VTEEGAGAVHAISSLLGQGPASALFFNSGRAKRCQTHRLGAAEAVPAVIMHAAAGGAELPCPQSIRALLVGSKRCMYL